jgi:hypothetical protein
MRPPVALKLRLALSAATPLTLLASPEAEATGVDPNFDFGDESFISTHSLSLCHCVRFASRTGQSDDLEALHLQAHSIPSAFAHLQNKSISRLFFFFRFRTSRVYRAGMR